MYDSLLDELEDDVVSTPQEVEELADKVVDAEEADVDLLDMALPGDFELRAHSFDEESDALAADLFVSLPPGCYEVAAYPARDFPASGWLPSLDCAPAPAAAAAVEDGATAELLLISQCAADEG